MVEEELMTGADEEFIDSGSNETVDRDSDILLVPFVEVMDQCLYAPRETQECVDFERHGPSLNHAITRRYVFMVVVLTIAMWSLGNSVSLDAIGRIMNIEKNEGNREVLNAVVSEVTVLGFIALVSGVASRTNFLNKISPAVFGEPPSAGAHGDLFLLRLVGRLLLGEDPSPEDFEPSTAAAIERFPDIRDGRTLAELTVLFEDIHIGLFLIMMTLIILAVLNFYQVNSIVEEWERAESLIQRHAPNEAYQMLNTLVAKLGNGFHRGFRMRVYMMYISYRQEFLNPSTGVQPDGVDSVSFPFLEYLRRCAGAALVESVEVPLWMYAANGIMVLCVRPWLAMGNEGTCDVRFFCVHSLPPSTSHDRPLGEAHEHHERNVRGPEQAARHRGGGRCRRPALRHQTRAESAHRGEESQSRDLVAGHTAVHARDANANALRAAVLVSSVRNSLSRRRLEVGSVLDLCLHRLVHPGAHSLSVHMDGEPRCSSAHNVAVGLQHVRGLSVRHLLPHPGNEHRVQPKPLRHPAAAARVRSRGGSGEADVGCGFQTGEDEGARPSRQAEFGE